MKGSWSVRRTALAHVGPQSSTNADTRFLDDPEFAGWTVALTRATVRSVVLATREGSKGTPGWRRRADLTYFPPRFPYIRASCRARSASSLRNATGFFTSMSGP